MKTYFYVSFIIIVLLVGFTSGKHYVQSNHNKEKIKHVGISKDIYDYVNTLNPADLDNKLHHG